MKKVTVFGLMVILGLFSFVSCNMQTTGDADESESDKSKTIEINYLEDFVQFENHEQVVAYFGEENVMKTDKWEAEGSIRFPVSVVNFSFENQVIIYWEAEQEHYANFQSVKNLHSYITMDGEIAEQGGEIFPTRNQIQLGTTLTDFEEINEGEITFLGFAWDYGGAVIGLNSKFDKYTIFIGCPAIVEMQEWPEAYNNLVGDSEFSSQSADAKNAGLEIVAILYSEM